MAPQQKQKIKNEYSHWLRESFSSGNHLGTDGMDNIIADYFLSILDKELEEERGRIENLEIEKAHTYSSENADVYRAYDAGQEAFKKRVLDLIHNKS